MTGNRTTELLCKLLEERGIDWKDGDAAYEIEWSTPDGRHCSAMYWKPTFSVLISGCTPEQAIAATVGSGTLTAEHVREAVMSADRWEKPMGDTGLTNTHLIIRDDGWQAIADELNARAERTCDYKQAAEYWQRMYEETMIERTCHDTGENDWHFVCSLCGYEQNGYEQWNYCPNCGAKVVGE